MFKRTLETLPPTSRKIPKKFSKKRLAPCFKFLHVLGVSGKN